MVIDQSVILESNLTRPTCGHQKLETMPMDTCQWSYEQDCDRPTALRADSVHTVSTSSMIFRERVVFRNL